MRSLLTSLTVYGFATLLMQHPAFGAGPHASQFGFEGRQISVDTFQPEGGNGGIKGTLVLLHGTSGPDSPLYRQQAQYFADHGFAVAVPHFFDATKTTAANPQNYAAWARLIAAFTASIAAEPNAAGKNIFLVGYSLGASIALAAGSQGLAVASIAEWYGSLPDEFFYSFKTMPPLLILHGRQDNNIPVSNAEQLLKLCDMKQLSCDSHIYPDQSHEFTGSALDDADKRTLEFFSKVALLKAKPTEN